MKVVFLDRDGVINENLPGNYVKSVSEFKFISGAVEAIRTLTEEGLSTIIISNQAGVGKGLMTSSQLKEIDSWMIKAIEEYGGRVLKSYYCTHTAEQGCICRKPKPGLLFKAARDFSIDLKCSYFIGDNITDIKAGDAAGCRTILVLSGLGSQQSPLLTRLGLKVAFISPSIVEAVEQIVRWERGGLN